MGHQTPGKQETCGFCQRSDGTGNGTTGRVSHEVSHLSELPAARSSAGAAPAVQPGGGGRFSEIDRRYTATTAIFSLRQNSPCKGGTMRPAKPTALKMIQGTYRKDRAKNEPQFSAVRKSIPATISPGAKLYWKELAGLLEGARILTDGDRRVLELACEALAQHRAATVALTSFGLTYTTEGEHGPLIRARPEVGNRGCGGAAGLSHLGRFRFDASGPDQGCRAAVDRAAIRSTNLMTRARDGSAGNEAPPSRCKWTSRDRFGKSSGSCRTARR